MSTSARRGSVNSTASSTVTPGISPTVSSESSRPAKTSRCISCRNSWIRGPQKKCGVPSPSAEPGSGGPSGRWPSGPTSLEIMLMTSMRKPSTPRSSHHRIIA